MNIHSQGGISYWYHKTNFGLESCYGTMIEILAQTELKFKDFFLSHRENDIKLLCYRETLRALFTGNIMCLFLAHKLAEADSLTMLIFTRNLAATIKSCFPREKQDETLIMIYCLVSVI